MNKKLKKAMAEDLRFFWEFGPYRKWYEGMVLRAETYRFENGDARAGIVFATQSLDAAEKLHLTLVDHGCRVELFQSAKNSFLRNKRVDEAFAKPIFI